MWSAEAGNGLEARVGVGKTGKAGGGGRGGGGRQPPPLRPSPIGHPSPEIPATAPNPRLGVGGRSLRVAVPAPRTRRYPRRSRSDPGPGGGRDWDGSAEPGVSLPDAPQRRPSLLGRPFPFPRRESPTSRAWRKGRTEGGTGSRRSGVVVQTGRKRGGG